MQKNINFFLTLVIFGFIFLLVYNFLLGKNGKYDQVNTEISEMKAMNDKTNIDINSELEIQTK